MEDYDDSTTSESAEEPTLDEPIPQLSAGTREGSLDSSQATDKIQAPQVMSARAYQQEMLEESLQRNIIIAMDTGSGKTQVAILRMQTELERNHKLVWFLAPTVALTTQQFEVIKSQITSVQGRLLCGEDCVKTWSEQRIWDAMLQNIRFVVSTYQVLSDALKHGFVSIESLALIVFDEAHNCLGKHPAGRLMNESYWPAKRGNLEVPHILGLTASPVIQWGIEQLKALERTLDAVCRSPKKHREELMLHANRPDMIVVTHDELRIPYERDGFTPNMLRLLDMYRNLDISEDPCILKLKVENTVRSRNTLEKVLMGRDTFVQNQMRTFCGRSVELCRHLGPWAADYYINQVVSDVVMRFESQGPFSAGFKDAEIQYLAKLFNTMQLQPPSPEPDKPSSKVKELARILISSQDDSIGIVFVQERATVAVLAHFLSTHPETRSRFRVGAMVGTSKPPGTKLAFLDLNSKDDLESLHHFRTGKINLLVATSVLEEGIDVPACNLVICFDKPANLKSFIQRRGRARTRVSQLFLLVDDTSREDLAEWQKHEEIMKKVYEDDQRALEHIKELENSEDIDFPPLLVPETRARLTIDDAKSHLDHFCRTLTTRKFVDSSPYYIVRDIARIDPEVAPRSGTSMMIATVHLPISLPPEVRAAESSRPWVSEKNACKDAAFQAYKALYRAGLVNQNLLPMKDSDLFKGIETRPGMATVREQMSPWPVIAHAWQTGQKPYRCNLRFTDADRSTQANFQLVLPVPIPDFQKLVLHWDAHASWTVEIAEANSDSEILESAFDSPVPDDTGTLLALAYGHRWPVEQTGHLVHFISQDGPLDRRAISSEKFEVGMFEDRMVSYLVREPANGNHPYFYMGWLPTKPDRELVRRPFRGFEDSTEDVPYVVVRNWPKKAGYFRQPKQQQSQPQSSKPYFRALPASEVRVDNIPAVYAKFGLFIPSILHALEIHLVATELQTNRLHDLGLTDLSLVVTAISTPAAREPTDYEKIEFLGDSILKLCATANCVAKHPDWPEGMLSLMKDKFISNSTLCKAACEFGLDRFIIAKGLTLQGWRPSYVDDHQGPAPSDTATRQMSTKTLADVVEALIGASYLDGGLPKALNCISLFLPFGEWQSTDEGRNVLYDAAPPQTALLPTMEPLEELIGYTFSKKSILVEAMTHSSYNALGTFACLERLEFLGDAILDYIVVRKLFDLDPPLAHHSEMHLLRTALVNGDFLGFLAMEWSVTLERNEEAPTAEMGKRNPKVATIETSRTELPLWSFMRFASAELAVAQRATRRRHAALRDQILDAMREGPNYPWALLSRLRPQKFYSDVFESLLGAVWVDSGSYDECEALIERAGILPYMRRMLQNKVHVLHPREELGRLAVSESVNYAMEVKEDGDAGREYSCRLTVGPRVVAQVEGCLNKEEAGTKAAEEAIKLYRGLGGRWE